MKPSEVIDRLANVCVTILRGVSRQTNFGSRDAPMKLWSFMRPSEPAVLNSAQHHAASKLLSWAVTMRDRPGEDPEAKRALEAAIEKANYALSDPPPSQRRGRGAGRKSRPARPQA